MSMSGPLPVRPMLAPGGLVFRVFDYDGPEIRRMGVPRALVEDAPALAGVLADLEGMVTDDPRRTVLVYSGTSGDYLGTMAQVELGGGQ